MAHEGRNFVTQPVYIPTVPCVWYSKRDSSTIEHSEATTKGDTEKENK